MCIHFDLFINSLFCMKIEFLNFKLENKNEKSEIEENV